MTERFLHDVEPRVLYAATTAVVGLIILAAYLYLFKNGLAEYAILSQEHQLLEAKVDTGVQLARDIEALMIEVNNLTNELQGESSLVPLSEMIAHTINKLDHVSKRHEIRLAGVKPGSSKNTSLFEEIPFHIEVWGNYLSLYPWLHDVEKELGPMVVKQFTIQPQGSPERLRMQLSMIAYRPMTGEI